MKQTYEIPFAVEETLFYPNKTGSTYFINFSGGRTCYRCHVLTPTDLQIFMCLPLMGNNLWIMCVCVLYTQQRARMFRPVALMLAYLLFFYFFVACKQYGIRRETIFCARTNKRLCRHLSGGRFCRKALNVRFETCKTCDFLC